MGRLTESSILNLHNKSYAVTADVVVPKSGAEGVIIALGGITGGWSLYAKGGKLEVLLQLLRPERSTTSRAKTRSRRAAIKCAWSSRTTAAARPRAERSRSTSTASRSAKGASIRPSRSSSRPTRRATSAPKTDRAVTTDYSRREFTGAVNWVELELGEDAKDADHYIKPEERLHLAMAIQ